MFWVVSTLVFWVLGIAPSSPNWAVLVALIVVLFTAGATIGSQRLDPTVAVGRTRATVSSALSGGLIGFYGAATVSGDRPGWTTAGTLLLATGAGAVSNTAHRDATPVGEGTSLVRLVVLSFASVAGYGAAFVAAAWTIFAIDAGRWLLACGLALASAIALAQPVRIITRVLGEILRDERER